MANLQWRPLDAEAFVGFQILHANGLVVLARWNGTEFEHGSGVPVGFEPIEYLPASTDA